MEWTFAGRAQEFEQLETVLALDGPSGFVVVGDAGVGKSRLLAELATAGTRAGVAVSTFSASVATARIPFGAFASVLPDGDVVDRLGLLRRVQRVLREQAGPRRSLVVVDDAHALDEHSVALVHHLATSSDVRLALSARGDLGVPDGITGLWKDGHLQRIEVGPLDRIAFDRLLRQALPGHVPRAVAHKLWGTTLGHPLYLRVLVDAAIESGALFDDGDGWRWHGAPARAPRLVELVRSRTSGLDERSREAFELLALAEPIPEAVADAVADREARARLESRGLVTHAELDGATIVRTSHPLFAEVIVGGLGPAQRRTYAGRLADAWIASDIPGARLHAARWGLDAGSELSVAIANAAARDALVRFDYPLTRRLAGAALERRESDATTHFLLGEALRHEARGEEAAAHFERAAALADDDETRVEVAIACAKTEAIVNRRVDRAQATLRKAHAAVRDPVGRRRLAVERTYLATFVGDLRPSGRERTVADGDATQPVPGVTPILVEAAARVLSVELDGVDALVARGLTKAAERGSEAPHAEQLLNIALALARIGQGRAAEGFDLATRGPADAVHEPVAAGIWAYCVAFAGGVTGDLDLAADAGLEACRWFTELDPFGLRASCAAISAAAALQAGRGDDAKQLMSSLPPPASRADARLRAVVGGRVVAWQSIDAGLLDEGAHLAAGAGRAAAAAGQCLWGAVALHDAVRFGRADLVVDDLGRLASTRPGSLIGLLCSHARALDQWDREGLEQVARRFMDAGCRQFAAESDAQAARLAVATGDDVAAARAATRAWLRWETCSGRTPPALVVCPQGITHRERQIVELATSGLTSRQIADRLVVSVRTVDNHLRKAYRALGIGGRDELAGLLAGTSS